MTQRDTPKPATPTETVVKRMRELREQHQWSVQQLADRCAALGMPALNRSVLANLEAGRRQFVTVDELLVLATALDCAPVNVLVPLELGDYLVTPEHSTSTVTARIWVCGRFALPIQDDRIYWRSVPSADQEVEPYYIKARTRHPTIAEMKQGGGVEYAPDQADDEGNRR